MTLRPPVKLVSKQSARRPANGTLQRSGQVLLLLDYRQFTREPNRWKRPHTVNGHPIITARELGLHVMFTPGPVKDGDRQVELTEVLRRGTERQLIDVAYGMHTESDGAAHLLPAAVAERAAPADLRSGNLGFFRALKIREEACEILGDNLELNGDIDMRELAKSARLEQERLEALRVKAFGKLRNALKAQIDAVTLEIASARRDGKSETEIALNPKYWTYDLQRRLEKVTAMLAAIQQAEDAGRTAAPDATTPTSDEASKPETNS